MDEEGPPLAESAPACVIGTTAFIPYYHRESNTVKMVIIDQATFPPNLQVIDIGPAPDFNQFFGMACNAFDDGEVYIEYPGQSFLYDSTTMTLTDLFEVLDDDDPFFEDIDEGPIGSSSSARSSDFFSSSPTDDTGVLFSVFSQGGSAVYSQFGHINRDIPTLNQWGLISLGLILLIIGTFYLRRRKARA